MLSQSEKTIKYINEQIANAPHKVRAYVFDESGKKRPSRNIFIKIQKYFHNFTEGKTATRWITLSGLRGAGKTTILSQMYFETQHYDAYRILVSMDQAHQLVGISLNEIITTFEELIGRSLEQLDKPLLLFVDEAQYDPHWGVTLKTIFDRSNKVFILATGSAALLLTANTDIVRRTIHEKLFPLSFSEYLKITQQRFEIKSLARETREALFESSSAKECFEKLQTIEQQANTYYLGITKHVFRKYLYHGSLPFMVEMDNEALVYDQINKTIDRVISGDILSTGRFSSEILTKIPAILYAVADMDAFNYTTISKHFEISRPSVIEIFNVLVQTELLHKIMPLGSHLNQTRQPSKFLFASPAFRAMYYKLVGNTISDESAKGKLHEDLVGMYLQRIFHKNPGWSLTFDGASGGADFIVSIGQKSIVIEVSAGSKDFRQVRHTASKVRPEYSLVISDNALELSEEYQAVKVPLRLFLLC